jgi:ribosomal protein S18 acetylase RimI-like enzyme
MQAPLEIRPANREEIADIARSQRRAWASEVSPGPGVLESAWWTRMEAPGGVTLVGEAGGRRAGFVCAMTPSRDDDASSGTAEIAALYVEPASRRSGVAGALMGAMTGLLRGRGFAEATLWVRADDPPARRLYDKLGWRPDGGRKRVAGVEQLRLRVALDVDAPPRVRVEVQFA